METSVAAVTVRLVVPETPLSEAVIVEDPTLKALAKPAFVPAEPIVATFVLEEVHVTVDVMFCFEESE